VTQETLDGIRPLETFWLGSLAAECNAPIRAKPRLGTSRGGKA